MDPHETISPVFLPDPVNRDEDLNRGRALWWLSLDGLDGGRRFLDLNGIYPGTLTNLTGAGTGWATNTRPGGMGKAIATDGVSGIVISPTIPGVEGASKCSWACWMYRATGNNSGAGFSAGASSGGNRFAIFWTTDGTLYVTAENVSLGYGFTNISAGWHRMFVVYDGTQSTNATKLILYVDAQPQTLTFSGPLPTTLGTVGGFVVGRDSNERYTAGAYDDASVWPGRALPAAMVRRDYDQSRRRYPAGLRRLATPIFFLGSSAPPSSSGTVSVSLDSIAAEISLTAATPASSVGSVAAAIADIAGSVSVTSSAPASSSGSVSVPIGDVTAIVSATSSSPSSSDASIGVILQDLSGSASLTSTPPGSSSATVSLTLGNIVSTASGTSSSPASSVASASVSLGGIAPSVSPLSTGAGDAAVVVSVVLGSIQSSVSVQFGGVSSSSAAVSLTLDSLVSVGSVVSTAPGSSAVAVAATLGDIQPSASARFGTIAVVSASLGNIGASVSITTSVPSDVLASVSASLGPILASVFVQVGLLPSLPESIVNRVQSIPPIIDRLPGGFWFGTPDDESIYNQPYGVLTWIGEQTISYVTRRQAAGEDNSGPVKAGKRTVFQVTLVGPDFDVLDQIHDTWEDYFHPAMDALQIRRRFFRSLFNDDPQIDFGDVPASPSGYNAVSYHWTFEVITNTRPT